MTFLLLSLMACDNADEPSIETFLEGDVLEVPDGTEPPTSFEDLFDSDDSDTDFGPPDTDFEDLFDTGEDTSYDTGQSTDLPGTSTDDTGTPKDCRFPTETWDGTVDMGNQLNIEILDNGGLGQYGGYHTLSAAMTAEDPDCANLYIPGFTIVSSWTDLDESEWGIGWVGTYEDGELTSGTTGTSRPSGGQTGYTCIYESILVPAGETVIVDFEIKTDGAAPGDELKTGFYTSSMALYDGENEVVIKYDTVYGTPVIIE
jgi:hypothetical protein